MIKMFLPKQLNYTATQIHDLNNSSLQWTWAAVPGMPAHLETTSLALPGAKHLLQRYKESQAC